VNGEVPAASRAGAGVPPGTGAGLSSAAQQPGHRLFGLAGWFPPAGIWDGAGEGAVPECGLDPCVFGQDSPSARAFSTWSISGRSMSTRSAATARSPTYGSLAGGALNEFKRLLHGREPMLTAGSVSTCAGDRPGMEASIAEPGRSRQMTESTDLAMCLVPPVSGGGYGRA
jgi:hypothetical protein